MQRYELKDGKSQKFWEIEVEGDSFTVRYGRIGTSGQTSTKTFADEAKARVEADKLIKSKTKKGYQLVGEVESVSKQAGGNPELEARLLYDPTDIETWQVYGDWLQDQGDPRGELVAIDCALEANPNDEELVRRREALLAEHKVAWLGKDLAAADEYGDDGKVLELDWKYGFIHRCLVRASWGPSEMLSPAQMLRALLKLESFKFVHHISVGITSLDGDATFDDELLALSKAGKLRSLRRLIVGDFDYQECEISWSTIGNVGRIWPVMPNLDYLEVHGGGIALGNVAHDKLRELVIETGGLPGQAAESLGKAKLPNLERLTVWFGTDEYGGTSSVANIEGLLAGEGYPKLRHLGLQNADFQDDIAIAVCKAPIIGRIKTLDLSMGTMTGEGARAIAAAADHFKHLASINLEDNHIDDESIEALESALGGIVRIGTQKPADGDWRYVTVGE